MPGNSERPSFLSGAGKAAKGETEEKGNEKDKKDEAPPEVRRPCSSLFQIFCEDAVVAFRIFRLRLAVPRGFGFVEMTDLRSFS